jgi:hypothetical protein
MDPAPGYDPKMPHDMAHFIVENGAVKGYTEEDILRVCRRFDAVSATWETLEVGGSLTLEWQEKTPRRGR